MCVRGLSLPYRTQCGQGEWLMWQAKGTITTLLLPPLLPLLPLPPLPLQSEVAPPALAAARLAGVPPPAMLPPLLPAVPLLMCSAPPSSSGNSICRQGSPAGRVRISNG